MTDQKQKKKEKPPIEKRAYRVEEFCRAYGIGRTKAFEEISEKRLRATKVGRLTLIKLEAAEEWFSQYEMLPSGAA